MPRRTNGSGSDATPPTAGIDDGDTSHASLAPGAAGPPGDAPPGPGPVQPIPGEVAPVTIVRQDGERDGLGHRALRHGDGRRGRPWREVRRGCLLGSLDGAGRRHGHPADRIRRSRRDRLERLDRTRHVHGSGARHRQEAAVVTHQADLEHQPAARLRDAQERVTIRLAHLELGRARGIHTIGRGSRDLDGAHDQTARDDARVETGACLVERRCTEIPVGVDDLGIARQRDDAGRGPRSARRSILDGPGGHRVHRRHVPHLLRLGYPRHRAPARSRLRCEARLATSS